MTFKTVFNTTDSPVVVDSEGRSIGGFEHGTVDTTEDLASDAMDAHVLIPSVLPTGDVEVDPQVKAAHAATKDRTEKAERLRKMEKDDLAALAASDPSTEHLADEHKGDMVAGLAARDVEPDTASEPVKTGKSKTTSTPNGKA